MTMNYPLDRPDKGSGYDRTIDFKAGLASNTRKSEDVRIVVAGELVRIRCEAGNNKFINQNFGIVFIRREIGRDLVGLTLKFYPV